MRKKLVIAVCIIAAIGILGTGIIYSSASQMDPSLSTGDIQRLVDDQYPGDKTEAHLKSVDNRPVYEVDILDEEKAYSLELDGDSGKVLNIEEKPGEAPAKERKKKEANKQKETNDTADETEEPETEDEKTVISIEKAKKIALEQFAGEIEEIELEKEDGRLIYEVEIERGEQEAEIEIDAYTGEVIVIEIEED